MLNETFSKKDEDSVYDNFHPPQVYYLLIPQPMISARKMTSDLRHIIKSCVRYMLLINEY